jgi:branched-chain amino acid transport system permease protein/neutral amino acid transport system permease protein
MMTVLRDAVGRIGLAWTPAYTTIAIVALAVVVGFLPFVKMSLVVNGVFLGAIIALGAIGLTIVYGLLNFANVAHGDYMTMGAYVALFIVVGVLPSLGIEGSGLGPFTFGYPVLIALPLAVATVAAGAIVLDVTIYRRLRARGVNAVVMSMASLGIAIALRGLVQVIWTGEVKHFPRESRQVFHLPMDVRVPPDAIFIAILALILVAAVYVILTRTRMGKAMRATADNPDLALVSGIDTRQVIWWAWGMAAALSATAGILLAVYQAQLLPIMGWKFLIPLFAAVILGGLGNPYGALVGAFVIGVTSEVSTQWLNPSYKPAVAFAIMIIMLLVRPRGIFGEGRN